MGVRRDFQKLEQRRLLGARLLRQGIHPAEVARQVGVHRQSVSRWAAQLKQGGVRALKKSGHAGRRARLRPEDLRRIERGLKRGPQALGYETNLWTSWRVAHLIEQECGIKYHPSQAWRILRQLGWSCQRPVGRALERDEDKIRRWKQQRWPEIKKSPQRKPHHRLHRRERIERAPAPLPYLGATPGKLLIVWDGLTGHRSRMTWEFIRQQGGRFVGGISSRLCPGSESGRVPVVALEATRVAEFLPAELWPVKPLRPQGPAPHAEATHAGDCLLAAGRAISVILCNPQ